MNKLSGGFSGGNGEMDNSQDPQDESILPDNGRSFARYSSRVKSGVPTGSGDSLQKFSDTPQRESLNSNSLYPEGSKQVVG